MREDVEFTHESGPHAGWETYTFDWHGKSMRLLTVTKDTDGHDRSSIWANDYREDFQSVHIRGILTVNGAYDLLEDRKSYGEASRVVGYHKAQAHIREALGIRG
jgi:hypothetical protein